MTTFSQDDELLTAEDTAGFFGVSTKTLAKWRNKGTGPRYVKIGSNTPRYTDRWNREWLNGLPSGGGRYRR